MSAEDAVGGGVADDAVTAALAAADAAHPWGALAPGYALGALDADERQTFEAHLVGCAACQGEARAYAEVAAELAGAAAVEPPPAALRARILAEARRPRLVAGAPDAPNTPAGAAAPAATTPPTRAVSQAAPGRAGGAWRARTPWLAAAASLLVAAGAGAAWRRERDARTQAELALRARPADPRPAPGTEPRASAAARVLAQRDLAERDSTIATLNEMVATLTESDVRTARLAATGAPAAMRLTWNRRRGVVVVTASALPAPNAGRTYQLWGIKGGGAPQNLGTFAPGADGRVRAVLRVPPGAAMDVAAVTEEPAGGSPRPTSSVLMTGVFGA